MLKKTYLTYIHNLRGVAIAIIVAIHARMAAFSNDYGSSTNKVLTILLDNGTIIFVFISGFLFHHVFTHNLKYKKYLFNKFRYVLVPYFIASILPILDKLFIDKNIPWMTPEISSSSIVGQTIYMLVSGKHFGPFWFIPMITIYYLLAPLLVKINKRWFYFYVFPVLFGLGLFTYQFGYYSNIIDSFIFYLPIYLLGMLISQYKNEIFKFQKVLLPILLSIYFTLLGLEMLEIIVTPKLSGFIEHNQAYFLFNPAKLRFSVLAIALMILFKRLDNIKLKWLTVLGDYSFGIYFIHLYFVILINKILQLYTIELPTNLLLFVLLTTLSVATSVFMIWVIKLIFKDKSRILIGS